MRICGTTNAYNKGCRCDDCCDARSRYMAGRRVGRRTGTQDLDVGADVPVPFTTMPVRGEWRAEARCAALIATGDADADWWYAGERGSPHAYDQARKICAACPVATECLQWAIELPERFGMWGGLTPHERRSMQRTLRAHCLLCDTEFTYDARRGHTPKFCSETCRHTWKLQRKYEWNARNRQYAWMDA